MVVRTVDLFKNNYCLYILSYIPGSSRGYLIYCLSGPGGAAGAAQWRGIPVAVTLNLAFNSDSSRARANVHSRR